MRARTEDTDTKHGAAGATSLCGMGLDMTMHGMPPAMLSSHDADSIMPWTYDPEDRFGRLLVELDNLSALPPPETEQHTAWASASPLSPQATIAAGSKVADLCTCQSDF